MAPKGDKNIYQHVNCDEKECLTVLLTGNAGGELAPPMIVFKYERIPKDLAMSVPSSWGIGKSANGWMCGETFYEYLSNIFHPWLVQKRITLPVILFIDGHSSHLTLHTSKFCDENGIILISLHPNSTHLIQPMDVAVFRTLKESWRNAVHEWRLQNVNKSPILRKTDFAPLLRTVLEHKVTPDILKNGFRKCGLVPWKSDAPFETTENIAIDRKRIENRFKELQNSLGFIENYIDKDKILQFRNTDLGKWEGDREDLSLFNMYKNVWLEKEKLKTDLKLLDNRKNGNRNHVTGETEISNLNQTPHHTPSHTHTEEIPNDKHEDYNDCMENIQHCSSEKIAQNTLCQQSDKILNPDLPSPFKNVLFWPEEKKIMNRKRNKEKIPSVVSSQQWQIYHEKKELAKKKLEEEKKKRAEERLRKKEEKEELTREKKMQKQKKKEAQLCKKRIVSSDSETEEEWEESGDSLDDISEEDIDNQYYSPYDQVKEGESVLVAFPGKKKQHRYVCIIRKKLPKHELEVVGLKCCNETKTHFIPNEEDVSNIQTSQIIEVLPHPNIILFGERVKYEFPEPLYVDG